MKISVVSAHGKLPSWVQEGIQEYGKRLPKKWQVEWIQKPLSKKSTSDLRMEEEGSQFLANLKPQDFLIALDRQGASDWSSEELSKRLHLWEAQYPRVVFLIGGPDGLAPNVLKRANLLWSLSAMTFPHSLVQILLAESIYRSWAIGAGLPYHK
jgi:23S rRNA (pseudouridine1915-N3)-methyltransferase